MSQGSDINETVTVSNDGISVEKTVTAEEFPVPAVVFRIESTGSESAHVRLTDQIPESFPMERVGFHPEFESDRWTAYKDHRVEFERDLDAGEELKTVYGIRTDDMSDLRSFLIEPSVKELTTQEQEQAADIEGVLGPDNSQLVRDVLSGDRSSLPGVDDAEDPLAGDDADPLAGDADDPLADATPDADAGEADDDPTAVDATADAADGAAVEEEPLSADDPIPTAEPDTEPEAESDSAPEATDDTAAAEEADAA